MGKARPPKLPGLDTPSSGFRFRLWVRDSGPRAYLEGQGDLVSRIITPINHIVTPCIPIINLLTKSP